MNSKDFSFLGPLFPGAGAVAILSSRSTQVLAF